MKVVIDEIGKIGESCVIVVKGAVRETWMKGVIGVIGDVNNLSCLLLYVGKNINSSVCNTNIR